MWISPNHETLDRRLTASVTWFVPDDSRLHSNTQYQFDVNCMVAISVLFMQNPSFLDHWESPPERSTYCLSVSIRCVSSTQWQSKYESSWTASIASWSIRHSIWQLTNPPKIKSLNHSLSIRTDPWLRLMGLNYLQGVLGVIRWMCCCAVRDIIYGWHWRAWVSCLNLLRWYWTWIRYWEGAIRLITEINI